MAFTNDFAAQYAALMGAAHVAAPVAAPVADGGPLGVPAAAPAAPSAVAPAAADYNQLLQLMAAQQAIALQHQQALALQAAQNQAAIGAQANPTNVALQQLLGTAFGGVGLDSVAGHGLENLQNTLASAVAPTAMAQPVVGSAPKGGGKGTIPSELPYTGIISSIDDNMEFAFIKSVDAIEQFGEDIFLHKTRYQGAFEVGAAVRFAAIIDEKKRPAVSHASKIEDDEETKAIREKCDCACLDGKVYVGWVMMDDRIKCEDLQEHPNYDRRGVYLPRTKATGLEELMKVEFKLQLNKKRNFQARDVTVCVGAHPSECPFWKGGDMSKPRQGVGKGAFSAPAGAATSSILARALAEKALKGTGKGQPQVVFPPAPTGEAALIATSMTTPAPPPRLILAGTAAPGLSDTSFAEPERERSRSR